MRLVHVRLLMLAVALPIALSAQPAFDVTSIKENTAPGDGGSLRFMPSGGVEARHFPAWNLITFAYQIQRYQLLGAPDWAREAYYDVSAKPAEKSPRDQMYTMMRAVLVDRFQLKFHRENRQLDGFALVRVRRDALGSNVHASQFDCEKNFAATPQCRIGGVTATTFRANGAPVWSLLQVVIGRVNAPVSDDTGLTGTYDIELHWSNDIAPTGDEPTLFTALQEQLGLKLERRRVETDVFVVDRFERPSLD
jgi:uncharacterized protein (TIGR03435 family)